MYKVDIKNNISNSVSLQVNYINALYCNGDVNGGMVI